MTETPHHQAGPKSRRSLGQSDRAKRHRAGHKPTSRRGPSDRPEADHILYGLHAVEFALLNPKRTISMIWATENAERKLASAISSRNLSVTRITPRDLDKKLGSDTVHQGIALEVSQLAPATLEDVAEKAFATGHPIVLLDQVTDPHNVGAVLRSGAVFGAAGLIMTQRHSPPLGGTLAKAASGALDLLPVCLVQNLAAAISELKRQAFPIIGLDGTAEHRLLEDGLTGQRDLNRDQPVVLALGAEGKGLRERTRDLCDELCRIGGDGPIASLNVSNAAAIALHLAAMRRRSLSSS